MPTTPINSISAKNISQEDQDDLSTLLLHSRFLEDNHLTFLKEAERLLLDSLNSLNEEKDKVNARSEKCKTAIITLESKLEQQKQRLESQRKKQQILEERISLLFRLLNYNQPKLSDTENKFFRDLKDFQIQTKDLSFTVNEVRILIFTSILFFFFYKLESNRDSFIIIFLVGKKMCKSKNITIFFNFHIKIRKTKYIKSSCYTVCISTIY